MPPPSIPWIFICPSSRGIGHALTRHILHRSTLPILATTRDSHPHKTKDALLRDLVVSSAQEKTLLSKRLSVVECDVTDERSVISAAETARKLFPGDTHHLHVACAMPGVLLGLEKSPAQVEVENVMESYRVNALGPLLLSKHFFEFLPRRSTVLGEEDGDGDGDGVVADMEAEAQEAERDGKDENGDNDNNNGGGGGSISLQQLNLPKHATWVNMSARVGSTTDNRTGGWFSYRASKAAVNSLTKSLDIHLRMRAGNNAMAVSYHPGTVRTSLSKAFWESVPREKLFSPEYAAERMADVVFRLGVEQRGRCWDWSGKEVLP